jgi:hypothetical protein
MPRRYIRLEVDDVEGHMPWRYEDMTGKTVTIRTEDGTEVQGHGYKVKEDMTGEDAEGHAYKRGIDLEVDDSQAHLLKTASDRGEPVYVRFPDGAEVTGHARIRSTEDQTGEDTEGHGRRIH